MQAVTLHKPTPGRSCVGLSCCAPSIIDIVIVLAPDQWKIESFCRGHFLEWAADVETFEFPEIKFVMTVSK